MLGLSYSSILMPALRRLQRVKKKEKTEREETHSSPCSMPVSSTIPHLQGFREICVQGSHHAVAIFEPFTKPALEGPEHQCAFPWLTSRQSTRFTVRTTARGGKCALAINARHHDRCQQTLTLAEQQQRLRNLCWGIGKNVTRPFNLQHRDLFLVGVLMQLLNDTCVGGKHPSYQQNVYFAVLQWQVFATEKKKLQNFSIVRKYLLTTHVIKDFT